MRQATWSDTNNRWLAEFEQFGRIDVGIAPVVIEEMEDSVDDVDDVIKSPPRGRLGVFAEFADVWPETLGWQVAYDHVLDRLRDRVVCNTDVLLVLRFAGRPSPRDLSLGRATLSGARRAKLIQRRLIFLGEAPDDAPAVVSDEIIRVVRTANRKVVDLDPAVVEALLRPLRPASPRAE